MMSSITNLIMKVILTNWTIQYNAALFITGIIKIISQTKLYEELCLEFFLRSEDGSCDFVPQKEKWLTRYLLNLILTNFMTPFYEWGLTVSRLQSHSQEIAYFLPLSRQKFVELIWPTSQGWKVESTLEPTTGQHSENTRIET